MPRFPANGGARLCEWRTGSCELKITVPSSPGRPANCTAGALVHLDKHDDELMESGWRLGGDRMANTGGKPRQRSARIAG